MIVETHGRYQCDDNISRPVVSMHCQEALKLCDRATKDVNWSLSNNILNRTITSSSSLRVVVFNVTIRSSMYPWLERPVRLVCLGYLDSDEQDRDCPKVLHL